MQRKEIGLKIAKELLQIQAVGFNFDAPYRWSSGLRAPMYCDNRRTLGDVKLRNYLCECFIAVMRESGLEPDVIAGVATAGIPHGLLVADRLGLPFIYVRAEPKKHGAGNQIEGFVPVGKKTWVIEDLVSTGGSAMIAIDALRNAGVDVIGLASVFSYGFRDAKELFAEKNVRFMELCNISELITVIKDGYLLPEKELNILLEWKENPEQYSRQYGRISG